MKSIELKTHDKDSTVNTVFLIKAVLETPPPGGFTGTAEMRNRFKVLDKIDELKPEDKVLELEDGQAKTLFSAASQMKWNKMDKFIIDFEDSLK